MQIKQFLPKIKILDSKTTEWDIPYTISQLSYLTHSHYRYYGKFPSVVAGQILEEYPLKSKDDYVLDNFCGSGTTLVECKLRGYKAFGIDISELAVLASNVKCEFVNIKKIKETLNDIISDYVDIDAEGDKFSNKWFDIQTIKDLVYVQNKLKLLPESKEKNFLILGYLGIVRGVSRAHEAEVRPHINKDKAIKKVLDCFSKKIEDMCENHKDFMDICSKDVVSQCFIGNNLNIPEKFNDGHCHLVISHPPYLNCFNYSPVFSLEFYWAQPFLTSKEEIKELIAHPATDKVIKGYFEHLDKCYKETYRIQKEGQYLAIVIGDCTRKGVLIPVIDKTIEIVSKIGYKHEKTNYRTTSYGLGKYAYKEKADYHGDSQKKDAIIIFRHG